MKNSNNTNYGKVLAVDDDPINLDIISEYFAGYGYEVLTATDGLQALEVLNKNKDVLCILLDRMMPNMDGMECIKHIKQDPSISNIPVVMQTAASSSQQISEGIAAGVYYYLAKPYDQSLLLAIVNSAISEGQRKKSALDELYKAQSILGLMRSGNFEFNTVEQASALANFVSHCFPDPASAIFAISELLFNAVEHGVLGFSYDDKKNALIAGNWHAKLEERYKDPNYIDKKASLLIESSDKEINLKIQDYGKGFDWQKYTTPDISRLRDPNGRGIMTAMTMDLCTIEYVGNGNEVHLNYKF